MDFSIVVAVDSEWGIAKNGVIPWDDPMDRRRFKRMTMGGALIMGRVTYESMSHVKWLDRVPIVVTSRTIDGVLTASSLNEALKVAKAHRNKAYVVGGVRLYNEGMTSPWCRKIVARTHNEDYHCDQAINQVPDDYTLFDCSGRYTTWKRKENKEEEAYLALVERAITLGNKVPDRTGIGTHSLFGERLDFDLSESFPLFTTKRVFFRGVVEELLWFLRGCTDSKELEAKGVRIWQGNTSKEFIEQRGLDYEEGDIGPLYGFQWRHWGAKYRGKNADYTGEGIDQIARVIDGLKTNPHGRRHVMSAWNVEDLDNGVLEPCHVLCQFHVAAGTLSCQMYQRSADLCLGVPFNVASYALLTVMIAHVTGLRPGRLVMVFGDAHVYNTHVEAVQEQLNRYPVAFPQLTIEGTPPEELGEWSMENFKLHGYQPYPSVRMEMAV